MSELIFLLDNIENNYLKPSIDYLINKFSDFCEISIISYNKDDNVLYMPNINECLAYIKNKKPDLILTNHLPSLPSLNKEKYNVILWITDKINNLLIKRNENISLWRQNLGFLNSVEGNVYSCSQFVSKQILLNYRINTKISYPYIPPKDNKKNNGFIFYNKKPVFFDKLCEISKNIEFKKLESYSDFENAISYLHFSRELEYSNIEIPIASSYGVPCLIENYGCLSEYATVGDILIDANSNESIWISNFKILLRDKIILSKKIKDFSNKYGAMSEIENKIKLALKKTKHAKQMNFQEIQNFVKGNIIKNKSRPHKKTTKRPILPSVNPTVTSNVTVETIKRFLEKNENIYFGCGGLGDAILTVACCYNDKKANVIFGSTNKCVEELFECFKIPTLITSNFYPFSSSGRELFNTISNHRNFKSSGHIPENVNFLEWVTKSDYYLSKIKTFLPLIDIFGKIINPRKTKGIVGICPRGSDHKDTNHQRWISVEEFKLLVKRLLSEDNTVIAFGSPSDVSYYGIIENNNFIWSTSEFGLSYPAPKYPSSFRHMLSMINSCQLIYSVDTWLKTYSALAKIPTKIILSRRNGMILNPPHHASDYIFLNQKYWNLEFVDIKKII